MQILPSAARTTSGTSVLPQNFSSIYNAVFQLNVTAAAAAAGDTLDIFLQSSIDDTNYDDFIHFTQVLGNGGTKRIRAEWTNTVVSPTTEMALFTDATMAAGVRQGIVGKKWRIKWVIAGSTPSFTFSIDAELMGRGRER